MRTGVVPSPAGRRSEDVASSSGGAEGLPWPLPTRAGLVVLLLAVVILMAGMNSGVNTLFLLSGVLFGAVVVSGVVAWMQVRGLRVGRRLPEGVHAGEVFNVELRLSNPRRFSVHAVLLEEMVELAEEGRWRAFSPHLPGRGERVLRYSARVRQRGVVRFGAVRLSSCFPFGMVRVSQVIRGVEEGELVVYPALGEVHSAFLQGELGGVRQSVGLHPGRLATTDIHGLREYRPGDNPKWIHWRSSARLGKPVVKEFDREEARRLHLVLDAVLADGQGEFDEHLERVVSFLASLAVESVRPSRRVGLTLNGAQRVDIPCAAGAGQVRLILEHLARLHPARQVPPPLPPDPPHALRNVAVVAITLGPERARLFPVEAWRAAAGSFRLIDATASAFEEVFTPPDVLKPGLGPPFTAGG